MNRIDTPGSVAGDFVETAGAVIPTQIGAAWLNDIQEDLVGWILISGQSLSAGVQTQLLLGLMIIAQAQLAVDTGRELELAAPMALAAGEMFASGDLYGTAVQAAALGLPVTMTRTGTRTLPKTLGETWLHGQTVFQNVATRKATTTDGDGRKRIGFASGPSSSAATTAGVILDGNSSLGPDPVVPGPDVLLEITPPASATYAAAIGVLNDQTHVVVLWEGVSSSDWLSLYDVTDSATPLWTVEMAGGVSATDRIWVAKDVAVFLLQHLNTNPAPDEDNYSKYNVAGQIWETQRYNTGTVNAWGAGISADGARVVLFGTDTLDNQGMEIVILDGADETPTTKVKFDSIPGSKEHALSSNGAVLVGSWSNAYAAHAISADLELTTGPAGASFFNTDFVGPGVAVADSGLAFILSANQSTNGAEVLLVVRIAGTWTEYRHLCAVGKEAFAVAISGDGTKALWVEALDSGDADEAVVYVLDVATGAIATDGKGTDIVYPLTNSGGTAKGEIRDVELTQDGSKFLVISHENGDEATAWIGQTGVHLLTPIYTAPAPNYRTRCAGMALDGGLVAVGSDAGAVRTVTVYDLNA